MKGDKMKQEINNILKFLETHIDEIKHYLKNNEFLNEVSFIIKNNIILFKDKAKIILVKVSGYTENTLFNFQEYIKENKFLIQNKKNLALSTLCIAGGLFTFLFSFNGDLLRIDVNAEDTVERTYLSNSSNLQFPTLSVNGQLYATDAKLIEDKIKSYDFYNNGEKVVYLTFDDGPSKYTKEILTVLKKYNIRGTFFVTGTAIENGKEEAKEALRDSYVYGNSIGNHTYSHDYKKLYPGSTLDLKAFQDDLNKNSSLLKDVLGESFETNIVRCPGGSMSWGNMNQLDKYFDESNKSSIDWNALTDDSYNKNKDVDVMLQNAINTSKDKNLVVLLMHETNENTPKYLDDVIKYYHSNGYEFKTLA